MVFIYLNLRLQWIVHFCFRDFRDINPIFIYSAYNISCLQCVLFSLVRKWEIIRISVFRRILSNIYGVYKNYQKELRLLLYMTLQITCTEYQKSYSKETNNWKNCVCVCVCTSLWNFITRNLLGIIIPGNTYLFMPCSLSANIPGKLLTHAGPNLNDG